MDSVEENDVEFVNGEGTGTKVANTYADPPIDGTSGTLDQAAIICHAFLIVGPP